MIGILPEKSSRIFLFVAWASTEGELDCHSSKKEGSIPSVTAIAPIA